MAIGALEAILEEVSDKLGIPGLRPDANDSCLVRLPNGMSIQIEMDTNQQNLLLCVEIGETPPGAFRRDLYKAALKDNATPSARAGIFAYSEGPDVLLLWRYMDPQSHGGEVADVAQMMITKGAVWWEAIQNGRIPDLTGKTTEDEERGGPFGIKM